MSEAEILEEEVTTEGFVVEDDQAADWAVRKIAEADRQLERMEAWYQHQLSVVREKHDSTVAFFSAKLAEYLSKAPAKETKTQIKYSLASGDLVLTKAKSDFKAQDDDALLGWCQVNAPELVKVTMKPSWSDVKKRLTVTDSGVVDSETGMIVDGVQYVDVPQSFKVRVKGD